MFQGLQIDQETALLNLHKDLAEDEGVVLSDELDRATSNTLHAVAHRLSPKKLDKALEAAGRIVNESMRTNALSGLAEYLTPAQLDRALGAAKDLKDEHFKAELLGNLGRYLSHSQLDQALHIATRIGNETALASALGSLGRFLGPNQLGHAFQAAKKKVDEEPALVIALGGLARGLAGSQQENALEDVRKAALKIARNISSEGIQADAIAELAQYLSPEEVEQTLRDAATESDEKLKARLRGILASKLEAGTRAQALEEALHSAIQIDDECVRAEALCELMPYLSDKQLRAVVEQVRRFKDDTAFTKAVWALERNLAPEHIGELRARAEAIQDNTTRADVLSAVAPQERTVSVMMPFGGDDPYLRRKYKLHYNRLKENFRRVKVKRNGRWVRYRVSPFYTAVHSLPIEGLKKVVSTDILVSLVSHKNINVIYETGIREVVKGGVIRLVEGVPSEELPVYLSHQGYIPYETPSKSDVGKAIDAMAEMDFSEFIMSPLEGHVFEPLRVLVEKKDSALREQLASALQEIENAPPGDAPEILNLFREVPPSRIVATWDAYFPYCVIRIRWKRMSGDDVYREGDLEDEPVVCAANRAFLNLFDIARLGKLADPDGPRPLTQAALANRLQEEGYVDQSTFDAFLTDQRELLRRLVYHCETDWATQPLYLDGDNHHPYYHRAHFLPSVIAKWTIGDICTRHEQYFLVSYVRLDHDSRDSL